MISKNETKMKFIFIVEGTTEEAYFREFVKNLSSFKFEIECVDGGDFVKFTKKVKEYKSLEIPLLFVLDLDRLARDDGEQKNFEQFLKAVKQRNKFDNIFFTYKNFETFLEAHFSPPVMSVKEKFGIEKGDEKTFEKIVKNGGSFEKAVEFFSKKALFLEKKGEKFGKPNFENLDKIHSALYYFKDYCEFVRNARREKEKKRVKKS